MINLVKKKRIYLKEDKSRYFNVRLYQEKKAMWKDYEAFKPDDGFFKVAGVHCGYVKVLIEPDGAETYLPETGTVFLCSEHCGLPIVAHELMHAVLYGWKHALQKEQYPIVIKDMAEEEEILYSLTYALWQYCHWYWKIEKLFK